MAKILRGKEVADALTAQMQQDTQALKEAGLNLLAEFDADKNLDMPENLLSVSVFLCH